MPAQPLLDSPTPLKVPMLLVISEELAAFPMWLCSAPSATVVFVPGAHIEMFKPPALSIVRDALLERLHLTVPRAAEPPASRGYGDTLLNPRMLSDEPLA